MPKPGKEKVERFKKGELRLAQVFDVDAKQIAALLLLGHRLYQQGQLKKAKNVFEGLAVLDGRNPYVHAVLGAIHQKEGNDAIAITRYNMALNLYPEDITCLTNRGEIYLKLGKFEQAASDFQKAIDLDPEKGTGAGNRARLLVAGAREALKLAKEKGVDAILDAKKRIDKQMRTSGPAK
ncbi:tetratricopeptide repeat protein [bacterium]|nr:tetratricopeptide repeat protein [bacterium]MCI0605231.1 tetratricopeptide repeat protein [bacterium]